MDEVVSVWLFLVLLADNPVNYHCVAPCMCSRVYSLSDSIPILNGCLLITLSYVSMSVGMNCLEALIKETIDRRETFAVCKSKHGERLGKMESPLSLNRRQTLGHRREGKVVSSGSTVFIKIVASSENIKRKGTFLHLSAHWQTRSSSPILTIWVQFSPRLRHLHATTPLL
jgi:hypothetical protein